MLILDRYAADQNDLHSSIHFQCRGVEFDMHVKHITEHGKIVLVFDAPREVVINRAELLEGAGRKSA